MDGAGDANTLAFGADKAIAATRTTCPYCGVGCGVLATPDGQGGLIIKGDPDHPANFGRLCSKGMALGETVDLEGRLLHPMVNGKRARWDEALELVADRFRATIAEHGPDSVAFYVSGQMLTEDYYVANKLMKGFIGSGNIDTNSRLCMASTVAGHRRAFGTDTVPGNYEDLEQADLIVLVGSNLAWCHPVLFQRIIAAKTANPALKLVTIDPRRTATSNSADLHLGIAPGADVALFNLLLREIVECGAVDTEFVRDHVNGFQDTLAAARRCNADSTGLDRAEIQTFLNLWIRTEKVVTVFSQGVNQSTSGTDKVNAILNCHLATGRIGKPGMGPFSITGQPNAMGGREVGGMANTLACHLDIDAPAHRAAVGDFWNAPNMAQQAGLKAVDMFRGVGDGTIKALWVIATNPAVSMPDADAVVQALKTCDFVVVSDLFATTDTARLADVVLPATGWGEKDGTVTNSERCISRQRATLPTPGEARADWDILADVGRRMGWEQAFGFASPAEVFREFAALSGVAGQMGMDFDISGLAGLSDAEYGALWPTYWPATKQKTGGRFFGDGQFFTPDRKARMVPLTVRAPASDLSDDYPFRLNTGRVRDHWHTMTRTAKSARLSQHLAEPFVEVNSKDAQALGLAPASLALVESPLGRAILRVMITDRVQSGAVFAPMHWSAQFASAGRIDALVNPAVDPLSGQPESKASVVRITPYSPAWYGFAVSKGEITAHSSYWARARVQSGWRVELADDATPEDWQDYARTLFGLPDADATIFTDVKVGSARVALAQNGRLEAALFVSRDPVFVARGHIAGQLGEAAICVLAGRAGADTVDPGPTLCSCFNVGINTIMDAIEAQGLISIEAIGTALRAGTNCGSCRPEIAALIAGLGRKVAAK